MPPRRPHKYLPDGTINPLWWPAKIPVKRKKPLAPVDRRAESLVRPPFPCANCDSAVADARLYCRELCRQEAEYVRYHRACILNGKILQTDVREALRIRLAHILSGGYDIQGRRLPNEIRQAVIDRDAGFCRECGAPGREVDHIKGSSSDLANLQLLCSDCHRKKSIQQLLPLSSEEHPELWAQAGAIEDRVAAFEPSRICDDPDWQRLWRSIRAARRRLVSEKT